VTGGAVLLTWRLLGRIEELGTYLRAHPDRAARVDRRPGVWPLVREAWATGELEEAGLARLRARTRRAVTATLLGTLVLSVAWIALVALSA
jgi:hypothetical protein